MKANNEFHGGKGYEYVTQCCLVFLSICADPSSNYGAKQSWTTQAIGIKCNRCKR